MHLFTEKSTQANAHSFQDVNARPETRSPRNPAHQILVYTPCPSTHELPRRSMAVIFPKEELQDLLQGARECVFPCRCLLGCSLCVGGLRYLFVKFRHPTIVVSPGSVLVTPTLVSVTNFSSRIQDNAGAGKNSPMPIKKRSPPFAKAEIPRIKVFSVSCYLIMRKQLKGRAEAL